MAILHRNGDVSDDNGIPMLGATYKKIGGKGAKKRWKACFAGEENVFAKIDEVNAWLDQKILQQKNLRGY